VLELSMATALRRQEPAVLLEEAEDLGDFHPARIPRRSIPAWRPSGWSVRPRRTTVVPAPPNVRAKAPGAACRLARLAYTDLRPVGPGGKPWRVAA
jgi:hypothetical protein